MRRPRLVAYGLSQVFVERSEDPAGYGPRVHRAALHHAPEVHLPSLRNHVPRAGSPQAKPRTGTGCASRRQPDRRRLTSSTFVPLPAGSDLDQLRTVPDSLVPAGHSCRITPSQPRALPRCENSRRDLLRQLRDDRVLSCLERCYPSGKAPHEADFHCGE